MKVEVKVQVHGTWKFSSAVPNGSRADGGARPVGKGSSNLAFASSTSQSSPSFLPQGASGYRNRESVSSHFQSLMHAMRFPTPYWNPISILDHAVPFYFIFLVNVALQILSAPHPPLVSTSFQSTYRYGVLRCSLITPVVTL